MNFSRSYFNEKSVFVEFLRLIKNKIKNDTI